MQSYYIMQLAFYDSFLSTEPSQPYSYTYGDRPTFEFAFLPNEIAEGDLLVFAVDNDMVFYDSTPETLLHSASCMVVVRHDVTAEEATAGKVQMRIETRTVKFRDVVNGKVRPVEVVSGLYRRRGSDDDINYVLLAKGRAIANGIIADYNALPEPITTAYEVYSKTETDSLLDAKADKSDLVAHTDDATIHVTQQEKTEWSNKADRNDIGNATVTITQGGTSKGSFSVNASENVTIEVNDGAQADWDETDMSSPSYIQNKPSVYTKTETDALMDAKADKATTISGYGITDAYTKTEIDAKVSSVYHYKGTVSTYADLPSSGQEVGDVWNIETADSSHGIKAGDNVAWNGTAWDVLSGTVDLTPYATKDELSTGLDGKSDIDHLHTGKYVPLAAHNNIPGSYFVRGGLSNGGNLSTNGFADARLGFKKKGVSLDDIYAAKSHTHSVSEISGLESMASGGVEEFSDASKEWSASDIGKIFIYKGLTQGKFINGRLYHCLKYTHVISSGASEAYLMLTLSQSTEETYVNALAGRYDLTSGTVGTTNAVYTNSNGAEVYYNSTNARWAIRYQNYTEAFIMQSGGPEGTYDCWDYETSVSITATKYETAGGDPVTEERYCAVIIDTSPVPIIESTGDLTIYPGISYKLNLSGNVTLSADGGIEGMSGECEIYISTSTYSVTAGTNITFVDSLFSNTTNHCVIKWDGESAKLYVCEVR